MHHSRPIRRAVISLGLTLGLASSITAAQAQTGADFFKDKTVTYVVATAAGGGYDVYGRLTAEFMQRHLPGSTFVVSNRPGAGHLVGANFIAASKPDGLTLGTFNTGLIYGQLTKADGMRFDMGELTWIGKMASDPRVIVMAEHTPVMTVADMIGSKETLLFPTTGPGAAGFVEMSMLLKAMNVNHRLLTGYDGNANVLAMRRGEAHGHIGSRSSWDEFRKQGNVRMIAQIGGSDKDVPQLRDLVKDPKVHTIISLIESQGEISRFTAGPGKIPADRVEALRTAFRKATEDKELLARVEKMDRPLQPAYGEDVARMIKKALEQTPETIAVLKEGLTKK